jgi:hypothetical protein
MCAGATCARLSSRVDFGRSSIFPYFSPRRSGGRRRLGLCRTPTATIDETERRGGRINWRATQSRKLARRDRSLVALGCSTLGSRRSLSAGTIREQGFRDFIHGWARRPPTPCVARRRPLHDVEKCR